MGGSGAGTGLWRHGTSFTLACGACVLRNTWQPAVNEGEWVARMEPLIWAVAAARFPIASRLWCPRFAGTSLDTYAEANNYLRRLRGEMELPIDFANWPMVNGVPLRIPRNI